MYLITYRDGTTEPAGTYTAACNRARCQPDPIPDAGPTEADMRGEVD